MCGRFTLHSRDRIKLKGLASLDLPLEARYNIAPSQSVLGLGDFGSGLEARLLTWGLIPSWSTDGKGFINARAETLEEKPSFSEPFRLRRCLIPADGFFEWKRTGREKRPFYFQVNDEMPFAFAGIWDTWSNRGDVVTLAQSLPQRQTNWLRSYTTECRPYCLMNFTMLGSIREQVAQC